jgi:hypothetical protein
MQPNRSGEFTVVHPLAHHEFILVVDTGIDEVAEEAAFDAVVRLRRIKSGSVGHTATEEPVRVVAAAGLALTDDGLAAGIDSHRPDWAKATKRDGSIAGAR